MDIKRLFFASLGCWLIAIATMFAITVTQVTVATTPTLLDTGSAYGATTVLIRNPCAVSVYLGDATMTDTTTGFELAAKDDVSLPLGPAEPLYGRGLDVRRARHGVASMTRLPGRRG